MTFPSVVRSDRPNGQDDYGAGERSTKHLVRYVSNLYFGSRKIASDAVNVCFSSDGERFCKASAVLPGAPMSYAVSGYDAAILADTLFHVEPASFGRL